MALLSSEMVDFRAWLPGTNFSVWNVRKRGTSGPALCGFYPTYIGHVPLRAPVFFAHPISDPALCQHCSRLWGSKDESLLEFVCKEGAGNIVSVTQCKEQRNEWSKCVP